MLLLLLLGPLRDAVACALVKIGGTDNSRKLGKAIGLREEGFAYKRKLERIAFILRDYCIQPVIIAYACRVVRREWNMFFTRWLNRWRCTCLCISVNIESWFPYTFPRRMCSTRRSVRMFYVIGNSILYVIIFHFSVLRVEVIWSWLVKYVYAFGSFFLFDPRTLDTSSKEGLIELYTGNFII
jgi:hypothetical protein